MTLAVMTRATLGHTGRALKADAATAVIYLSVAASAAIRVAATALPEFYTALLWGSGLLWVLAFGLFVLRYGPLHLSPAPARAGARSPGFPAPGAPDRHGQVPATAVVFSPAVAERLPWAGRGSTARPPRY